MSEPGITPLAQRLAEENNVDWRSLRGSGAAGQVVERDVLEYLARVMAGDEAVNPTPEPVPDGLAAWPDEDMATGPKTFIMDADDADDEEDWSFPTPVRQDPEPEPEPVEQEEDLALPEDIFLFDDDYDDHADDDADEEKAAPDVFALEADEPEDSWQDVPSQPEPLELGVEPEEQLVGRQDDLLDDFEFEDADLTDLASEDGELDTPFMAEEDLSPFLHTQPGSRESLEEQYGEAVEEPELPDFGIDFSEIGGWDESGADDPEAESDPDLFTLEEEEGMEELLAPLDHEDSDSTPRVVSPMADLSDLGFDAPDTELEEADDVSLFAEDLGGTASTEDDSAWRALMDDSDEEESWTSLTREEEPAEEEPEPEEPEYAAPAAMSAEDESDIWGMEEPAAVPAGLPLADFGTLLRRHLDVTLLSQAQTAVGQELGLGSGGTALPFLMRAAARALESAPLTAGSNGIIAAAIPTADGLALVADPGGTFRDTAQQLEAVSRMGDGQDALPAGAGLAVADMSGLQVDEAVLNVGVPVLTLGRVLHDSEKGSFLSTLTLSGHYDIQAGARFLQLASELLANPLRLLI